jgi:transcriptional regulator with XRE-family HTH domain
MATSDLVVLGRAIRVLRTRAGLTQRQLAGRVGVDKPYVSRIENGHLDIRWSTLTRLLTETGATLADLQGVLAEVEASQREG